MDAQRTVAIGLLVSGRRVLLERRTKDGLLRGMWQFPGGKVEFGEHPWDALRRELREELGLRIANGSLFGVYSQVYGVEGGRIHYVLVAYRVPVARARIGETEDLRWFEPWELRKLGVVDGSRPIVRDFLRG